MAFFIATFFMLFAQFQINPPLFLGDAYNYWLLSGDILDLSFPESIRGYFYPLMLAPSRAIFNVLPNSGYIATHISQALFFSFSLTIALPYVFSNIVGGNVTLTRRLVVPFLVAFFFPALIAYTLSDLPALCLIIISTALIILAKKQDTPIRSLTYVLLAGVLAYGAYNTRTIYLFTFIALVPIIPTLAFTGKSNRWKAIITASFIFGSTLAATPQSLINLQHLNSLTPLVIANVKGSSLFASQLKWGITIQKVEGVHNPEAGATFAIYYADPIGLQLAETYKYKETTPTLGWYVNLLFSEPVSFLKIYTKHFINGIDVRDPDVYTKGLSKENNLRSIASISIVLLGLVCLAFLTTKKSQPRNHTAYISQTGSRLIWLTAILLPVFAIIPSAIETRFFLPVHVLAYCAIAFGLSKECIKSTPATVLILTGVLYAAAVSACYITVTDSISKPVLEMP
ncbi:hypothetical protein BK665_14065 [Pseudomonas frederiksbergensis]|uniref:Glycosyltransferase RgtA/B/C/D-like domain-containing protein n=1 Tax=Pseudomonas frederiksbergensis TaxID=104087 RepID=A0A423KJS3_9PSED|nr:hypothetical protein BK665_14065 [Pseudomonas frederiksbergensis]